MDPKYNDLHTTQLGFISDVLNQTKPALVVFYAKDEWEQVLPHMSVIEKFKEKVPALPIFLFDISSEKNLDLVDAFGIEQSPTFVIFKNGSMNRFLEENRKTRLNDKTIVKFLGSPALYGVPQEEAKKIASSLSAKATRVAKKEAAALAEARAIERGETIVKPKKGKLADAVAAQKAKNKKPATAKKSTKTAVTKSVAKPAAKKKVK